jgi:hypothetical protein
MNQEETAWIPRLQLWHEASRRRGTLPAEYRHRTLREVARDLFGGTAARDGRIWLTEMEGVETRMHKRDGRTHTDR